MTCGLDTPLRAVTALAAFVVVMTEALSLFHALSRWPVLIGWVVMLAAALVAARRARWPQIRWDVPVALACAAIAVILAITAFTAWLSPPNSADAMAYHLPRVVYWAQNHSVAFFPTPYYNQVSLPPAAEYLMLHSYLLSGGDHYVNFVQWLGFCGSILGVGLIARAMGLDGRAQAFAALFCATLPAAILAASGAKNDLYLALWMVASVYFALKKEWWWLGLAVGMALATKPTAWLFLPPLLVAILLRARALLPMAACILLLNGPQWLRNMQLSGSPLGFDSAQGDGFFRWRNDRFGLGPTVSNLLRHLSEQLGSRSEESNQRVYQTVLRIHSALGLDPNDPRDTWPYAIYRPPRNANHEADANSRWHLLLIVIAAAISLRQRQWAWYAAALAAGALAFCFYLKWQPFMARLWVPWFVAAAPLAARIRPRWLMALAAVFLLSGVQHPLLLNWTRPLKGANSLLREPREQAYFNDMVQWNNKDEYLRAVDRAATSGCHRFAIDIRRNTLEYPFMALVRERVPDAQFVHLAVDGDHVSIPGFACLDK